MSFIYVFVALLLMAGAYKFGKQRGEKMAYVKVTRFMAEDSSKVTKERVEAAYLILNGDESTKNEELEQLTRVAGRLEAYVHVAKFIEKKFGL